MNHFSLEVMGKEKLKDLRAEGMRGQELHRSGAPKMGLLNGLPRLILVLLGILGILTWLVR
jgi:hypothetical protein